MIVEVFETAQDHDGRIQGQRGQDEFEIFACNRFESSNCPPSDEGSICVH